MRSVIVASGAVLACTLAWCSCAFALNPDLDISQYAHTSWKIRDGFAKGTITSIAQTPDGYLWLGTEFGLLRFDGVKPVPWQPPTGQPLPSINIRNLLTARDGSLWIATDAGLARWKDAQLTRYEKLAGRFMLRLVEDRDGSLWATSFFNLQWSLCVVRPSSSVECYGDDGGPGVGAIGLYEDRNGTLWVGTVGDSNGVWRWSPTPRQFYALPAQQNGIRGLLEDEDGGLLISRPGGIARAREGRIEMAYPLPPSKSQFDYPQLLRDQNGSLWLGSPSGGGLVHLHRGRTDVFASSDGLSGDTIQRLFEDREGNIWVSTADGLDRFHDVPVAVYSAKQGLDARVESVLAARDGSIWVGTPDRVKRWKRGQVTSYGESGDGGVFSIFQDRLGRVWVSTRRSIGYVENDRFVAMKGLEGGLVRARRPIASGRIEPARARSFGALLSITGVAYLLATAGTLAALLAAITLASYLCVYTPLKRRTPLCTMIGAVPGAMPPLIGWAAARGSLSAEAWLLFAIVFLWQFPHFMAIAWMYREDYERAGYRVLPQGDVRVPFIVVQTVLPLVALLFVSLLPVLVGRATLLHGCAPLILGVAFLICGLHFASTRSRSSARRLLFVSILYLPPLLLTLAM